MQHHVYIADNSDVYVRFSSRVQFPLSRISWAARGQGGQPVLSPPSKIIVDNTGGYWHTAPGVSGGDFEGAWEGRKVKITREASGEAETTLGIFRIADEQGFRAKRDGTGELKLESLAEALKRGDASDISHGRGWHQQIPWTEAIRQLQLPEGDASMTLPDVPIPFEQDDERHVSSIGRPGSYQSDGLHQINELAVDVCYNEAERKFCYLLRDEDGDGNLLYEYDPDSGEYSAVSHSASITAGYECMRVWWRRTGADTGYYLIMAADEIYAPKTQTSREARVRFWRHTTASYLAQSPADVVIAPAIFRDTVSSSGYDILYIGHESFRPDHQRENCCFPFQQYPFTLSSRGSPNWQMVEMHKIVDSDDNVISPLISQYEKAAESWHVGHRFTGTLTDEDLLDSDLRSGRGLYTQKIDSNTNEFPGTGSYYPGLRHCFGQGPMIDVSFEHTGDSYNDNSFWYTCVEWSANRYCVRCNFFNGTSHYTQTVEYLPSHRHPTFTICDITRPSQGTPNSKGAVFFGWIDYYNSDDVYDCVDAIFGHAYYARSGFSCYPVETAASESPVTFGAGGGTMIQFGEDGTGEGVGKGRWYETAPGGEAEHISGRWTPVSMGYHRKNTSDTNYYIPLVCLDRMEMGPAVTGSDDNHGDARNGAYPYRFLYVKIKIEDVGGVQTATVDNSDSYGIGEDNGAKFSLPPMGLTRIHTDDSTLNNTVKLYFYSPGDSGLYSMNKWGSIASLRPEIVGHVSHADAWMGPGNLAVGNVQGDIGQPRVCGLSWPAFPFSQSDAWPDGEYSGWYFGERHSGRIPLLENKDLDKWKACGLASALSDSVFTYDRAGDAQIIPYPDDDTVGLDLWPSDYAAAERYRAPIVNHATRSVNDVIPGETRITMRLTPKSEFESAPTFTGLGPYPVDLHLKCIGSGRVSSQPLGTDEGIAATGALLWGFRLTEKRIQTTLSVALTTGSTLHVYSTEGVDIGDIVTLSAADADMEVLTVSPSAGTIGLNTTPAEDYAINSPVYVDKRASGRWSHELKWDGDSDFEAIAKLAANASAADRTIEVSSLDGFAANTLFQVHDQDGTNNYSLATYRVERTRSSAETGGDPEVDFYRFDDPSEGLTDAVYNGDPVTTWLNVPPDSRSVQVGQTGVIFGIAGAGGTASDDTEKPASEGDLIELSYPGLISKKNQNSKISSIDQSSIDSVGRKKDRRIQPNRYMDHALADMDVRRRVRRGAEKRSVIKLSGVTHPAARTLEPYDIVAVHDDKLLPEATNYTLKGLITAHHYNPDDTVDLTLEELSDSSVDQQQRTAFSFDGIDGLVIDFDPHSLGYDDGQEIDSIDVSDTITFTQGVASQRPTITKAGLNGYDIAHFDGTDDYLTAGDTAVHDNDRGLTVFAVYRWDNNGTYYDEIIGKYHSVNKREWFSQAGRFTVQESASGYDATTVIATGLAQNTWGRVTCVWEPSTRIETYIGSTLQTAAATQVKDVDSTVAHLLIGAQEGMFGMTATLGGDIARILVYDRAVTTQEQDEIQAELNTIYGV